MSTNSSLLFSVENLSAGLNDVLQVIVQLFHQLDDISDHNNSHNNNNNSHGTSTESSTILLAARDHHLSTLSNNYLALIKRVVLVDTEHHSEETTQQLAHLSQQLQQVPFFPICFQYFPYFPLELRKDIGFIATNLVRKNAGDIVSYFQQHAEIIEHLLSALVRSETALYAGQILREASKYPYLAYYMFLSSHFWHFFETYLHSANFDIASESFSLIKELLTAPQLREVQDGFYATNGEVFIQQYNVRDLLISLNTIFFHF